MEDMIGRIDEFVTLVIVVLGAVQSIVVYVLPPEKAVKYNWIGKGLELLSKTKAGLSPKVGTDVRPK